MIVEDSWVVRTFLEHVVNHDPRLEVVAAVESGEQALRLLHRLSPDVISMDIRLPGMNGFETTTRIMEEKPTPIVVVSASVESAELKITMNALRAGALTVLEKPLGIDHENHAAFSERLCTQLAIMSEVKVIRQRRVSNPSPSREPPPAPPLPHEPPLPPPDRRASILALAASTGGPGTLASLLCDLGPDFPLPILLVQHITPTFLAGFVDWLGDNCPLSVRIIADGCLPSPGTVHVAPPDHHLHVAHRGRLWATQTEPVHGQRPSGDVLFSSLAQDLGDRAIGVLLTGMGCDGAAGLLALRRAGAYTIAEDQSTAIVYGMPAAAVQLGAVCESLPNSSIGARLLTLTARRKENV